MLTMCEEKGGLSQLSRKSLETSTNIGDLESVEFLDAMAGSNSGKYLEEVRGDSRLTIELFRYCFPQSPPET